MTGDRRIWILCALALTLSAAAADPLKAPRGGRPTPELSTGPASAYIEAAVTEGGQFTFGVPGGPIILFGHPGPWSSYTTVRVDGADFDNNGAKFGNTIQPPTTTGNTNTGSWRVGSTGVDIQQTLTLVKGYSTNKEDTFLISYRLTNNSGGDRQVGLRVMFDTDLAGNDGAPFQVPGTGSVTTGKIWDGDKVPPYFFVFNDLTNPEVTAQASLSGGDIPLAPDRLTIAPWGCGSSSGGLYDNPWTYETLDEDVTCDSAYAVYFMPRTLASGASIDFATYYGLGGIEVDVNPPLISTATAPIYLDCNPYLTPNPFTVSLYIENSIPGTNAPVTGITATLGLPAGLRVAPGSEVQKVADLSHGQSALLSWNVIADGTVRGTLDYTITLASVSSGTKTIRRSIQVPSGCPTGDLPPVVGILTPPAGSQLACSTLLTASAWDDQGSVAVQYFVDELAVGGSLTSPPYSYLLDLSIMAAGDHTVYATGRDSTGHATKSNRVTFSIANPEVASVVYKPSKNKMRIYGDNLAEGQVVSVGGIHAETLLKTEALPVYSTDFTSFNTATWVIEGTVSHGDGEIRLQPDASAGRNVPTPGFYHLKVNFTYAYENMDEGEGLLLEYSTAGPEGPWLGGFSDLSLKENGSTKGWKKGYFYCPASASNNGNLWLRFNNVRTQNHLGPDGVLRLSLMKVVSMRDYLLAKKVPKIGPAQTVSVTVLYENCHTEPYLYTRP